MKKILGASIGDCIHVAGILNFLKLCEGKYETIFLGSAIKIDKLIEEILNHKPDIIALSYRLSPESAKNLFDELGSKIINNHITSELIFGGTPPVAEVARKTGLFKIVFSGEENLNKVENYINDTLNYGQSLITRINQKYPYPLLRHHFGLPSLKKTIEGARIIAESKCLDILSIGPDQNAQEHFFHPEKMNPAYNGAGGVPIRTEEDLQNLFIATRCGNFPLIRCYAGTNDLIRWAKMLIKTINVAWGAVPLCWYSVLDRRSQRDLLNAITENQSAIKYYAENGVPVEINESHQWSLRYAHDSLAVAMFYVVCHTAKKLGVKTYVAQYMFNTPPGISPRMDLAKMLAKKELITRLEDENFRVITQIRAGLAHFLPDFSVAKGQLSASTVIGMSLKPHIIHVVGFPEAHHAAQPEEVIESCGIVHGVLKNCLYDMPDITSDNKIIERKNELLEEAEVLLDRMRKIGDLTQPWVIVNAIKTGLLDAPQLKGNEYARGEIKTQIIDGKCVVIDSQGKIISEKERILNIK